VPAGPFAINDLPVVNGNGQIALVVRDITGREQVINQSFASSLHLMRKGLAAHSFELGMVRENFGRRSNDYGKPAASGTYRYGLTNALTAEGHVEATADLVVAGSAFAWQTPLGVVLGNAAFSNARPCTGCADGDADANGSLLGLGFERSGRVVSFGTHAEVRDRGFRSLATELGTDGTRPHVTADVFVNRSLGRFGSVGAAYVWRNDFDGSRVGIANVSHSTRIGPAFVGVAYQHVNARSGSNQLSVFMTMPLGGRHSASVGHQAGSGAASGRGETLATVQRNAPAGEGFGYMLQAGSGGDARAQGRYHARAASFDADVERVGSHSNSRVSARGGVGLVGGKPFASRPVVDSFALVRAPAAPNTRVYANNQEVGRTDERGELVIPGLRSYEENVLRLEQLDLGLDVGFQTLQVKAVPYRRSGVVVEFPLRRSRAATMRVVRADGQTLPVAARLTIGTSSERVPVGQDGLVYLAGLSDENDVRADWPGHRCRFSFRYPRAAEAVPDLGTIVCEDVL
jgi:outer membrane usher protein